MTKLKGNGHKTSKHKANIALLINLYAKDLLMKGLGTETESSEQAKTFKK